MPKGPSAWRRRKGELLDEDRPTTWYCEACGWQNGDNRNDCKSCGQDRRYSPPPWICSRCDLINAFERSRCGACAWMPGRDEAITGPLQIDLSPTRPRPMKAKLMKHVSGDPPEEIEELIHRRRRLVLSDQDRRRSSRKNHFSPTLLPARYKLPR